MTAPAAHDGLSGTLREALAGCAASGLSGLLLVTGEPGGLIHLVSGGVVAIQTPGAPSAEVILLRSHRVSEESWDEAFAASAVAGGPMNAELAARSDMGLGELEALLRTALADAMFVIASGHIEGCRPQQGLVDCMLPLEPAAEADLLLAETARRVRVLAALPGGSLGDRDRVMAATRARRPGPPAADGGEDILALADGRRTVRDIAFASGRGVYATMLQIARLREAGVLTTASRVAASSGGPAPAPPPASRDQADGAGAAPSPLPQRRIGLPALPRRIPDGRGAQGRSAPHRLLRPRPGRNDGHEDRQ